MIRLLKRFADWLDVRFPPKVHITEEMLAEIKNREFIHCQQLGEVKMQRQTMLEEIKEMRESLAAIKDLLAKSGASAIRPESEKLRDEFIRGQFNRGPSRAEIEAKA